MPIPDHRLAICRRCRQPERIARGASDAESLLSAGRRCAAEGGVDVHVRLSQCLNCCDGGHTVRVEHQGVEVALVGIRTTDELQSLVFGHIEAIARREIPAALRTRTYQIWVDGELVFHRNLAE